MNSVARIVLLLSLALAAIAPGVAHAFLIPFTGTVVEYYNLKNGHYFMTMDLGEMAALDAGSAATGWVRTGQGFYTYHLSETRCNFDCRIVTRFYARGAGSHLFTLDPAEVAILEQSPADWNKDGAVFRAGAPDGQGSCGGYTTVYRLHNNRFSQGDGNHRWVTRADERARMVAKGWVDEGARFCVLGAADEVPIRMFSLTADLPAKLLPSAVCEDESVSLGGCIAFNNLTPSTHRVIVPGLPESVFASVTGFGGTQVYVVPNLPNETAATTIFVQANGGGPDEFGIHVDTIQRGPAVLTSINPLYQFRTSRDANGADPRIFPFSRAYETDGQLLVQFEAHVKTISVRNDVSHAFGHTTLELIDQKSGRHLYFTTLAFGTVLSNDLIAIDGTTGKVIVGTAFRPGSRYMRNGGREHFPSPRQFHSSIAFGEGGNYSFRMDRSEFQRVLDDARTIDAALSSNPEDYFFDNFHFNNEVFGDGEIGMNLRQFSVSIVKR